MCSLMTYYMNMNATVSQIRNQLHTETVDEGRRHFLVLLTDQQSRCLYAVQLGQSTTSLHFCC